MQVTPGQVRMKSPKVAVSSVSLVDQNNKTLFPVLLGDRVFSGAYSPRAFKYAAVGPDTVDLRFAGSTGTSFLNKIVWSISAITVTTETENVG